MGIVLRFSLEYTRKFDGIYAEGYQSRSGARMITGSPAQGSVPGCDGDGGSVQKVFVNAVFGRDAGLCAVSLEAEYADKMAGIACALHDGNVIRIICLRAEIARNAERALDASRALSEAA